MRINIDWDGKTYAFDPDTDLTVGRLRILKNAFGDPYGRYVRVMQLASEGDADALVGVYWVMKQVAGEPVDPRRVPDFAVGTFMQAFEAGSAAAEAEEGEQGVDPTSSSSDASPA